MVSFLLIYNNKKKVKKKSMKIEKNTCYKMTHHLCRNNKEQTWNDVCNSKIDVFLVFGDHFGMLCMNPRDEREDKEWVFTITEYDHIWTTCMKPMFVNQYLRTYMPNGDQGYFVHLRKHDMYNDAYILRTMIWMPEERFDEEFTVKCFFDILHKRIQMRRMFMKLYFRCFRRAFHPDKNQALLLKEQFQKFSVCARLDADTISNVLHDQSSAFNSFLYG